MTPRDRLRRLVPRSSRAQAALLVVAAMLAYVLAFVLGRAAGVTPAPLGTATPLVPRSEAVEISGLPAGRPLPTLRPQPVRRRPVAKAPARPALVQPPPVSARPAAPPTPPPSPPPARPRPRPVVIVGEG